MEPVQTGRLAKDVRHINVADPPYGARGDGSPGDGAILLAALEEACTTGRALFIPDGTWLLDSRVTFAAGMFGFCGPWIGSTARAIVVGAGRDRTILRLAANPLHGVAFQNLAALTLCGMTIEAEAQTEGSGIALENVKNFVLSDIAVRNAFNNGIAILDDSWYGSISGFLIEGSRGVGFNGSTVDSVGYGIVLSTSGAGQEGHGPRPRYIRINDGLIRNVFASGINVSEACAIQISNVQVVREPVTDGSQHVTGYAAVSVKNNAENILIDNLYGEGTSIGFLVIGASDVICTNSIFFGNWEQGVLLRTKVENGLPPRRITVRGIKVIDPCQAGTANAAGFLIVGGFGTRLIENEVRSDGKMQYGFLETENPVETEYAGNVSRGAAKDNAPTRIGADGQYVLATKRLGRLSAIAAWLVSRGRS